MGTQALIAMSLRPTPFGELGRLFERMGRQFSGPDAEGADTFGLDRLQLPEFDIDVLEDDEHFVLRADLPGFDTDAISVRVTDTTVHIRAEQEDSSEEDDRQYRVRERRYRSLSRSIPLPEPIDAEDVTATYDKGVLELTIPRAEPATGGRAIDIS